MKICDQQENTKGNLIPIKGHIYKADPPIIRTGFGQYGIITEDWETKKLTLHSLLTGEAWTTSINPFHGTSRSWIDVTDQYCLKEI